MKTAVSAALAILFSASLTFAQHWPQGSGPSADYVVSQGKAVAMWSVVNKQNIAWTQSLPETGQSTVTIYGDRLFYTCYVPVEGKTALGSDIVAYCAKADTGEVLWKQTIKGKYPLKLSGCFADSTSPPAVTDGKHVCFFNASGTIACFDLQGKQLWTKQSMAVGRSQPFLVDGKVVYTRQAYMPKNGTFHFKGNTEALQASLDTIAGNRDRHR